MNNNRLQEAIEKYDLTKNNGSDGDFKKLKETINELEKLKSLAACQKAAVDFA